MTQPQARQLFDAGNALLSPVQANLDTGVIGTPQGRLGVLTIRTAAATVTIFLDAGDMRNWAALLSGLADELGGLAVATPGDIALLGSHGKQPSGRLD